MQSSKEKSGYLYAFLAYFCWGFFPIYWKFLKHVPLMQILAHRVLWAFIFYTIIIWIKDKKINLFKPESKKVFVWLVVASIMLMCNWLLYIYAVNSNQVIESSLGYFINPIVNILFGVYFLKEKLSKPQIIASICAALGVIIIALDQGHLPLIALVLALTFSLYGLIKKTNPLPSLQSNQFESFFFVIPALVFIFMDSHEWLTTENQTSSLLFLLGSGLITGLPLLFFSEAAKKIPYYMMGFFQFLAPTLQFLCGVLLYNEPLSRTKITGFVFIWTAAILLATTSYVQNRLILQKR